jgi:NtrC-family two-component system sensor histidine kinase KinB
MDAVFGSSQDGLLILDNRGEVQRINAIAERQLGIATGAATGKTLAALGAEALGENVSECLASNRVPAPREVRVEQDADVRVLACCLQHFEDNGHGGAGVAMSLRDVTEQREFETLCGDFVLRASHELRTPIASVRMGLGLLGEKLNFPVGSRDRELYDTVQHELSRMVELLSGLLDLSRLRLGERQLAFAEININEVLNAAQQRFAAAARQAEIDLDVSVSPTTSLLISREAFDSVLDNLINNALRHTPPSGYIRLAARQERSDVILTVADSGSGIAHAQQALMFQPFARMGTKRAGAGLGLALCAEIVKQHGGRIAVDSRPRHGTRFTITLPIPLV